MAEMALESVESPQENQAETLASDSETQVQIKQLVFIDSSIDDYNQLVDDLVNNWDASVQVVRLDSDRDGIEQITETLSSYRDLDALHIVSHGNNGSIELGNTRLTGGNMLGYAADISSWGASLSENADLLIYGCDLAADESGQALVDSISSLTGADVAASDDLTGHSDLGGDWDFEYVVGAVETDVAFSVDVQQNWTGTLESVTVTTLDDVVDSNATSVADLINDPGADGVISLREAIIASNANADADVIYLGAGVHTLSIQGSDNRTGDLDINEDVQIIGLANGSSVIDASGLTDSTTMIGDRVFDVNNTNNDVTFQYLTITGGNSVERGGGIDISSAGSLILDNVVVTGNHSQNDGGGIANQNLLTVTNSTISSNTSGDEVGGIASLNGHIDLNNVTLSGNAAVNLGGGVFLINDSHNLTNVTLSGNESNFGGGIAFAGFSTRADLTNVTIANNTAHFDGGGIFSNSDVANADVEATIISGNMATNNDANVNSGHFDDLGFNLIGDDPNLLGDLADNGGPVQTHALLPGSNAINGTGSQDETDSRCFLINDGNRDIGAFEFGATPASQLAGLLFTTVTDVNGSAVPGLNDVDNQDVIQIRDPDLTIENGDGSTGTSAGTFSGLIDFEAFADATTHPTAGVDGIHRVGTHVTFFGVDLQPGDVLFSTTAETTYTSNNSVTLNPGNVHLFRPDTPGDYSVGTFTQDVVSHSALGIASISGFTLVETDTIVGGQVLSAGDFLHATSVVNVSRYDTSASQSSVLVDGLNIGISFSVTNGIELIETAHTSGSTTLATGTLLLTTGGATSLGSNNIAADSFDVVALNLSSTGSGSTAGTASIVFDGSDVGLTSAERFNSLSLETVPDVQTDAELTDLSSGVEINTDGNNAYLLADNGATVLGGQDAVTVETIFASTSNSGWPTLFSYAAGHIDGNDFRIQFHPAQNELSFVVNGSGVFAGVPSFIDLFDGQPHSIAVSWSTTGDWALYVDGQAIQSGSFLEVGNSIEPGGTLLFGQEQLSLIHI